MTEASQLQRQAEELHDALSDLVRVYQFRDRDRICCHDVSVTQCYALETLLESGPMTVNALAAALYLDKSTTSRVIATLERKEYVVRSPHPDDGRAQLVSVTPAGARLCRRIQADLVAETKKIASDLEPKVREGAVVLLRRLAQSARARSGLGEPTCAAAAE